LSNHNRETKTDLQLSGSSLDLANREITEQRSSTDRNDLLKAMSAEPFIYTNPKDPPYFEMRVEITNPEHKYLMVKVERSRKQPRIARIIEEPELITA